MSWLKYTDDEVLVFHPAFNEVASVALQELGIGEAYHWEHHVRSPGITIIPDFVLVETKTNRWRLVVEIKRPRAGVYSERAQIQAKGYAEGNQARFPAMKPCYFCVTNLESSILFALNGKNPVRECRVKDMSFDSGAFTRTPIVAHKNQITADLKAIVRFVIEQNTPEFDTVWPRIARTFVSHAERLGYKAAMDPGLDATPEVVMSYFSGSTHEMRKREVLLRCLTAEYLKGILAHSKHPKASSLPVLRKDISQAAVVIEALKKIDFSGIFEDEAAQIYRSLAKDLLSKREVEDYLGSLISERVDLLAMRNDALEMPEAFIEEVYPHHVQDARGKARTDGDLAALLSTICIGSVDLRIMDPGCGDGSLLSASYDTLRELGASHSSAISQIEGIDADALATKIAALRLALKEPFVISSSDENFIRPADMFSSASAFKDIDVILINPPFKRFEQRDEAAIPTALRSHFHNSVVRDFGKAETDVGQANIYNIYIEYVLKVSKASATLGIILDNRWYHNKGSKNLRELLLRDYKIVAVISYPHDLFFANWTIATSILIVKREDPDAAHEVQFLRTNDPRKSDFTAVSEAIAKNVPYPEGWSVNKVQQSKLTSDSWQEHFSKSLINDFRIGLAPLNSLFSFTRSGRPDREGGGTELYALPFNREQYGPQRRAKIPRSSAFSTLKGAAISDADNEKIKDAASLIPANFRGYALINADDLSGYYVSVTDVTKVQMFESPVQRQVATQMQYFAKKRVKWTSSLDAAVTEIKADKAAGAYINFIESIVGLDETVLPREELWHGLREPVAGELIIPRKLRVGHRMHINEFAYNTSGRQVRISSNFFHYYNCLSIDPKSGLNRQISAQLIFGFLMSSFGQIQFEMEAYNREGLRSIEGHQLERIVVFDPRLIRVESRQLILDAIQALPYPVPTDRDPRVIPELIALDQLFADEIIRHCPALNRDDLLDEVWTVLFDWTQARRE